MQISCFIEILEAGVGRAGSLMFVFPSGNRELEPKSSCTLEAVGERRAPRVSGPHGPPELIPIMLILQKDFKHYWCVESPL